MDLRIQIGELFEFPHCLSGIVELWQVVNVWGHRLELRAITGNYPNDHARTVSARAEDIIKYKSAISGPAR